MTIELFDLNGVPLALARAIVLASGAVIWTLVLVRLVGLRSFAKMTSFDFVATVATASLIAQAATRSDWLDYVQAMAGIGAVFFLQWSLARARIVSAAVDRLMQNEPRLMMFEGAFCEAAMLDARVSDSNLLEKIRSSPAENLDQVRAVVLETTGDLSVLTGESLDMRLLAGVRGVPGDGLAVSRMGDDPV